MRAISAELAATAKSLAATPATFLAVEDRPPMAERVAVTPVTVGGADYDQAALCGPLAGGQFLRVYRDDAGTVSCQRLDLAGGVSAAVNLGVATTNADTNPTVAVCGSGDIVRAFWVHPDRNRVTSRTSIDGGASWGLAADVPTVPLELIRGVAAAWTTSGEVLFVMVDPLEPGQFLGAIRYNNGWGAIAYAGETFWTAYNGGLAADGALDDLATSAAYVLAIDGANGNNRVRGLRYNAASEAWAEGAVLFENLPGSGFALEHPTILARGHGGNALHLLAWLEKYTGTPAYVRHVYAWTPTIVAAPPATPWQYDDHGERHGQLLRNDTTDYLVAGTHGYRWPRYTGSAYQRRDDLGPAIVRLVAKQREDAPGSMTLVLNDDGGALANAGQVGTAGQMLRPGSTLNLGLGYVTANGPEYGYQQGWTIERVRRRQVRGKNGATSELILHCIDPLAWLDKVTTYYLQTHTNVSNLQMLERCVALVSGNYFVEPNADTYRAKAWYSLPTNQPFSKTFVKLLNECGLIAYWHSQQSPTAPANSIGCSLYGYAYWTASHHHVGGDGAVPVFDLVDGAELDEFTHVEAYGGPYVPGQAPTAYGEAWDLAALRRHERPLALKWYDLNLITDLACASVAQNLVDRQTYSRQRSEVVTPYDPIPELGELVALSDPFLGLDHATRYLRQIETVFDPAKGQYLTRSVLEASIV